MGRPMRVRQFRAKEEDVQRWRVLQLPYGDNDFSSVVRYALNLLYKQLVTNAVRQPGEFVAVRVCRCNDCHTEGRVNETFTCLHCERLKRVKAKATSAAAAADKTGTVTVVSRRRKARVAPTAKAAKGRKPRKGSE